MQIARIAGPNTTQNPSTTPTQTTAPPLGNTHTNTHQAPQLPIDLTNDNTNDTGQNATDNATSPNTYQLPGAHLQTQNPTNSYLANQTAPNTNSHHTHTNTHATPHNTYANANEHTHTWEQHQNHTHMPARPPLLGQFRSPDTHMPPTNTPSFPQFPPVYTPNSFPFTNAPNNPNQLPGQNPHRPLPPIYENNTTRTPPLVGWQQPLLQQQFPYPPTIHLITGHNTPAAPSQQQNPAPTGHGQHNYVDANIASIVSGMVQATLANLQQQPGIGNGTGGLQLSGKSAKILNGTNCFSLLGFCGLTIQDEIPEIFRILDSNEDPTTKFQALEDLLLLAQHGNALVNFTLRKETFKDIKQHLFHFDSGEKNMMQGFTPFCLQKMDKGSEIALRQLGERMERATYTSVTDLTKRDQSLKFSPITEPLAFLTAIANTHALAWALFTNASPLTQGLQDLQLLMLRHLHKGKLACAATFQSDWFAYVLWGIYECIDNYFSMRLNEGDLCEGAHLANPLAALHQELLNCPPFYRMQCPAVLLACPRQTPATTDTNSQYQHDSNKRPGNHQQREQGNGGTGAKKLRYQQQPEPHPRTTENFWNENKRYDASLKTTKQSILQRQRTNLGQVLRAAGMTTPEALNKLNLPTMLCGRYVLWGGCSDPTCPLHHDDTPLNNNNINKLKAFLTEGAKKLALPNPTQL